jgi:hypothetical protein
MKTKCTCELYDENLGHEEKCATAQKPQHTPTPWISADCGLGGDPSIVIFNKFNVPVARMDIEEGLQEANAAFIVRAVNRDHLFDELLERLKKNHETDVFIMREAGNGSHHLPNCATCITIIKASAKAAFIVRAVNCHAEMLMIVKGERRRFPDGSGRAVELDALIAKAEGKENQ